MKHFTPLVFLRIALGLNMLMHGLVRMPHLSAFATSTAENFQGTFLPSVIAKYFLYILPFLETLTGILILLGGKSTRNGLVLGVIILCILMFGTSLRQDWNTAGIQLIYVVAFAYSLSLYDQEAARKRNNEDTTITNDHNT